MLEVEQISHARCFIRIQLWLCCGVYFQEDETELTQYNEKQQQTTETPNGVPVIDNSTSNGGKGNSCNGEHEMHLESESLKSPDIETEHLNFLSLFTKRHLKFYTAFCIMAW